MARTRNEQRPEELLQAITVYAVKHGLAGLSLRPLAKAVGSSPRVLLYYFGSKEQIIAAIFRHVQQWQRQTLILAGESNGFSDIARRAWQQIVNPRNERGLQFFFECYGQAVRNRKAYKDFLHACFDDWVERLSTLFIDAGADRGRSAAMATILFTGLRGFALDYCATRDRVRVEDAFELWLELMQKQLESPHVVRRSGRKPERARP